MRKPTNSAMGTVSRMDGHDLLRAGTVLNLESVVWSICWVRCLVNSRWTSWNIWCGIRCTQRMQYRCCLWQCAWLWMLSFQSTKKDVTKTAGLVRWLQICWQHLEWRGFVWLRAMLSHRGGHAGFFECCLQGGLQGCV